MQKSECKTLFSAPSVSLWETRNHIQTKGKVQEEGRGWWCTHTQSSPRAKVELQLQCPNPGDARQHLLKQQSYFLTTGLNSRHFSARRDENRSDNETLASRLSPSQIRKCSDGSHIKATYQRDKVQQREAEWLQPDYSSLICSAEPLASLLCRHHRCLCLELPS